MGLPHRCGFAGALLSLADLTGADLDGAALDEMRQGDVIEMSGAPDVAFQTAP